MSYNGQNMKYGVYFPLNLTTKMEFYLPGPLTVACLGGGGLRVLKHPPRSGSSV